MSIVSVFSLFDGRVCTKCGQWRLFDEFEKNPMYADGYTRQCRDCRRAHNRSYMKQRRQEYPEQNKASYASWYAARGDEYFRQRRNEKREEMRQYKREWREANPEKVANENAHRTAWRRGAAGSHNSKEWSGLCARYGNRCLCCGGAVKLTRDHIIPTTDEGCSNEIWNIQPLCGVCNSRKNNRHINYRPDRLLPAFAG